MTDDDFADLARTERSHWWFAGMRQVAAAMLAEVPDAHGYARVLDAGCGTGFMMEWLERYSTSRSVIGADVAASALRYCRNDGRTAVVQSSVTRLPFRTGSFDLVCSFDVLQQLDHPHDDGQALREFFRILRPGGLLFLRVAAFRWLWSGHDRHMNTRHRYTRTGLSRLVEQAGFQARRDSYAVFFLFPLAAIYRFGQRLLGRVASDVSPLPPRLAVLNRLLQRTLEWEAVLLSHRITLPFGLSVVCLARKTEAPS